MTTSTQWYGGRERAALARTDAAPLIASTHVPDEEYAAMMSAFSARTIAPRLRSSRGIFADVPRQIVLIRHAEKPPLLGAPSGIDENGTPHVHSLIVRGWQRAGALASFFAEPRDPAIQRPTAVYAPPAHGADGDHGRPFETVTPTAAKLGLTIDTQFTLDEESALVPDLLRAGGVLLVAWEHNRIPRIANAILGDQTTAPQSWPDDRFDVVWTFDRDDTAAGYRFTQRPQLLLGGDCEQCVDGP